MRLPCYNLRISVDTVNDMALKKRVEILFEQERYSYLEEIARRRKTSVGRLIREAVDKTYLETDVEKRL